MEPTALEIEVSHVAYLLGETMGRKFLREEWSNVHPDIYGKCDQKLADKLTAELCSKLKKTGANKYSLEMQIWWRDHKEKDRKREQEEANKKKLNQIRKAALSKLTKAEKEALGLK